MEQNEPLPVPAAPEGELPPVVEPTSVAVQIGDQTHVIDESTFPPEPEAGPLAEVEDVIEEVVAEVEHVAEVAVDMATGVVHEIEHRTFGRPSAEHPMPVTIVKGA